MDKELLQAKLEEGLSLEEVGSLMGLDPSTISYWVKKHDLRPENRAKYAPKGGIACTVLERLVLRGLTLEEMAEELSVSIATIRYWLEKHEVRRAARTGPRSAAARKARAAGLREARLTCRRHGETEFVLEGRGYFRCRKCRSEQVSARRRKVKRILVEEAGGRCRLCGYRGYAGALEFHHAEPSTKMFALSRMGVTRAISEAREEANKCVLLCANCHAEVEGGVVNLPSAA